VFHSFAFWLASPIGSLQRYANQKLFQVIYEKCGIGVNWGDLESQQ